MNDPSDRSQGWAQPGTPPPAGWTPPGSPPPAGWTPQPSAPQPGGPPPGSSPTGGFVSAGPAGAFQRPFDGPKPGIVPLRPLGLSEILDGAIIYIRRSPVVTLGVTAAVIALAEAVQLALYYALVGNLNQLNAEQLSGLFGLNPTFSSSTPIRVSTVVGFVVQVVALLVLTGVLTAVIGRAVLGHGATLREVWRDAGPRIPALLGVALAALVASAVAAGVCLGPGIIAVATDAPDAVAVLLFVPGSLAAIAAFLWVTISFSLAAPTVVLERFGVLPALRRSYALVRSGFWRILGILLLSALIAYVISGVLQVPFILGVTFLGLQFAGVGWWNLVILLLTSLGGTIASTVVLPFSAGVPVLLYLDQRMRREGFDMELRAAAGLGEPRHSWPGMNPPPGG